MLKHAKEGRMILRFVVPPIFTKTSLFLPQPVRF